MVKPKNLPNMNQAAMVYAHGGGGVSMTAKMTISEAHRHAVECGCVVFSVDYRKGPEVQCPRNHLDFFQAIEHIVTNASQYGINRSEICAGGYSGGGWIVMGAMIQYLKQKMPNPIKAQFLVSPMVYEVLPSMQYKALHEWETFSLLGSSGKYNFYNMLTQNIEMK